MDRAALMRWVEAYEAAWRAPGTAPLDGLFGEGAVYLGSPFGAPIEGLSAIRAMWEAERSPDEEFAMTAEAVAVEGEVGVVRVDVRYTTPAEQRYLDLWIVRLGDDGRCTRFEEWPFWPPGSAGVVAGEGSA